MTPEHQELDPTELLAIRPLTVYRLVSARYANLSGAGAAQFPGRWNRAGHPALYTSLHPSTAILEKLVHTSKRAIPSNLAMMKIAISGTWEIQGEFFLDGNSSAIIRMHRTVAQATEHFLGGSSLFSDGNESIAIAVPSLISPSWNLVLYPESPAFWDIMSVVSIQPFEFDPRLFPDEAVVE